MSIKMLQRINKIVTMGLIILSLCGCFGNSNETAKIKKVYFQELAAVDLHGNLTNKGFNLEKKIETNNCYWKSTNKTQEYEYEATAYGDGPEQIRKIEAVVLNYSSKSNEEIGRDFLGYIASIPFKGSEPSNATAWVKENTGKAIVTVFGSGKYELFTNNKSMILEITPK